MWTYITRTDKWSNKLLKCTLFVEPLGIFTFVYDFQDKAKVFYLQCNNADWICGLYSKKRTNSVQRSLAKYPAVPTQSKWKKFEIIWNRVGSQKSIPMSQRSTEKNAITIDRKEKKKDQRNHYALNGNTSKIKWINGIKSHTHAHSIWISNSAWCA